MKNSLLKETKSKNFYFQFYNVGTNVLKRGREIVLTALHLDKINLSIQFTVEVWDLFVYLNCDWFNI